MSVLAVKQLLGMQAAAEEEGIFVPVASISGSRNFMDKSESFSPAQVERVAGAEMQVRAFRADSRKCCTSGSSRFAFQYCR